MTVLLTVADIEPVDGSVVLDEIGRRWRREGDEPGGIHWHRTVGDVDPVSWVTLAGFYGPVTLENPAGLPTSLGAAAPFHPAAWAPRRDLFVRKDRRSGRWTVSCADCWRFGSYSAWLTAIRVANRHIVVTHGGTA